VLYEAGAFGLPVVTTPVGAIPDLIRHQQNGLLVRPGDLEALTGAVGRLATDATLRTTLGAALREDVLAFHPDRAAERIAGAVRRELCERERTSATVTA
jgi:glycosyltransferase involved in cell wall biosynthesis